MSFYGSRYYQATDAFAKILIKNSGLNKKTFPTGSLSSEVVIEADGRTSELHLDTGNRWIKFKGNDNENKCTIYHDKADSSTDTFINIINKDNKIPDLDNSGNTVIKDGEVVLDVTNGVRFTVPLIYYDEAGHLSMPENGQQLTQSFVIPKIATAQEIDALKERMTNIEEETERISGVADDAKTEAQNAKGIAEGVKGRLDVFIEQYGKDQAKLNEDMKKLSDKVNVNTDNITQLLGNISFIFNLYDDLNQRVLKLEK